LWVALVDVIAGQPFHTAGALGGVIIFTAVHFLLNVTYGVVLVSAIHQAERMPSLVIATLIGVLTLQGAFGMLTVLLAQISLGSAGWAGIFGGSLIATAVAFVLLSRTHPLADYLHRAELER
jgi:heme A synthase